MASSTTLPVKRSLRPKEDLMESGIGDPLTRVLERARIETRERKVAIVRKFGDGKDSVAGL